MKIEVLADEKLCVSLSNSDLKDLDITYEEMDYSNVETRRVIWTVLDEAKNCLNTPINTDGRLLIEVCPDENGGCIMFFTAIPKDDKANNKRLVMKKEAEPLLLKLLDNNSLIEATVLLEKKKSLLVRWELFKFGEDFCIAIFPKISHTAELTYILGEYGDIEVCEKSRLAEIFENGQLLKDSIAEKVSSAEKT